VANKKSAIKRIKIAERNRLRNKTYKSAVRTLMKKCFQAVETYGANPDGEKQTTAKETLAAAYSKIDKAVKKGVLHANTAARKKSRLARSLQKASQPSVPANA
jgi:small subunit ribosomal protein S20